jgi:hypothetical protein
VAALQPNGAMDPLTLRFVDDGLERRYQLAAGEEGVAGLRLITHEWSTSGWPWSTSPRDMPGKDEIWA